AQKFASQYGLNSPDVPLAIKPIMNGKPWLAKERGPVEGLILFAQEKSGAIWLGSDQGAARFDGKAEHRWDRWQYFAGRRWLQDDAVENIYVDESAGKRVVWIRTRQGVSRLEWKPMTLEEKARAFEERIEARHVRHGLVADSGLRIPGDLQ